ncbi:DUF4424 family protein [Qipengyuania sp. JC766]|uniref:DUF4424 family protein n=1 Tax=Qipengyuania sp. JC766 TaxID=3232139 RepID=UPI00345A1DE0
MTTMRAILAGLTLALALPLSGAFANDSEAEWAIGGLVLKANDDISMDREDLFLSADEVRVDYVYTNHADTDSEVTIAFPLPALPQANGYADPYAYPDWDAFEFATTVDGEPVAWEMVDRAMIGDRDVTDLVLAEGLPVHWYRDEAMYERMEALPDAQRMRWLELGLLEDLPDAGMAMPAWQGQRHLVRVQTFPAGQHVRVSHRYTPFAGGSVGGLLETQAREEDWAQEYLAEYRTRYCMEDSFLAAIDRKLAPRDGTPPPMTSETWLGYVLSSGANWRGPIGEFRLVVDKGDADNLVSFCMDGVRKISPTQFEVVKRDFEPTEDLDILIVNFHDAED